MQVEQLEYFNSLVFKPHAIGNGVQAVKNFENEYGVSVVNHSFSYGNKQGLYEVAVMYKGNITYNTSITNDVLGWQSEEDVNEVMQRVSLLPKKLKLTK